MYTCRFFITVDNCKELSGKNTVFGRVVKGLDLVKRISQVEVDDGRDFKPTKSVVISHCGELEQERGRKGTSLATSRAEAAIADSSTDESHTGAKRHRLTSSPHSGSRMPSPHTLKSRKRHHRRDSENKRDETFRGRARTSTPLPEGRDSPAEELRRKQRDSSPSRPPKPKDEDAEMGGVNDEVSGKRRRKSLPNHKRCYDQKERRYEQGDRNKGGRHGPYNDERRDGDENEREKDYRPYREHGHHRRSSGYEDGVGTVADPGGVRLKGRGMMKYREQKEPGRL